MIETCRRLWLPRGSRWPPNTTAAVQALAPRLIADRLEHGEALPGPMLGATLGFVPAAFQHGAGKGIVQFGMALTASGLPSRQTAG